MLTLKIMHYIRPMLLYQTYKNDNRVVVSGEEGHS